MKNTKLLYYPILPNPGEPGAERSEDVRRWVDDFLIPAGVATLNESKANAYLVGGGDGLLMRTVRAKHRHAKIIFGVNRGTVGFLLNPVDDINELPRKMSEINLVTARMMRGIFYQRSGGRLQYLAFNDIFCGGNIADYVTFHITGKLRHFPNRTVRGNGVVVSTPQGTTGFALNNRGSAALLPLDSNHWFMSGVATGPYPSDQVTPQEITIEVESRNPVHGYADGYAQEARDIAKIVIQPTDRIITLGFINGIDFAARRTALAQKLERGE